MKDVKRKILVTGAAGFVGSALVKELRNAAKYQIYGIVRTRKNNCENHDSSLEIFRADNSVYETLNEVGNLRNIDTVVHSAGLAHQFGNTGREDFWKANVQGTENICRLAKVVGARQFILISSVSVYGNHGHAEIDESFECRPSGDYAESKLASELKSIEFCENNNLRLTILRLSTVIGEGDRGNTSRLITTIDKNRFIWIGKGINKKSLIYKDDAARGILKAVETTAENLISIYNLTAEAVPMSEIVGTITHNLNKNPPRIRIPESLVRGIFRIVKFESSRVKQIEKTLEKWLSNDVFSGKKFSDEIGFATETPISEAIARQVKFYLEQKKTNF